MVNSAHVRELKSGVETLRQLDTSKRVFGAGGAHGHHYKLNSPLTEEEVSKFEAKNHVQLPNDYRQFVTLVADGGAGPNYGVRRLNEAATSSLGKTFPWTEEMTIPLEKNDFWDQPGYLYISDSGCGSFHLLVVNGAATGQVWMFANDNRLFPLSHTFFDWYKDWLDSKLKTLSREKLVDRVAVGWCLSDAVDLLGPPERTWAASGAGRYVAFNCVAASFLVDGDVISQVNRFSVL